jgi:hypothetical protein
MKEIIMTFSNGEYEIKELSFKFLFISFYVVTLKTRNSSLANEFYNGVIEGDL